MAREDVARLQAELRQLKQAVALRSGRCLGVLVSSCVSMRKARSMQMRCWYGVTTAYRQLRWPIVDLGPVITHLIRILYISHTLYALIRIYYALKSLIS